MRNLTLGLCPVTMGLRVNRYLRAFLAKPEWATSNLLVVTRYKLPTWRHRPGNKMDGGVSTEGCRERLHDHHELDHLPFWCHASGSFRPRKTV